MEPAPTAEELREEAKRRGLSILKLCERAKVHPSQFHRWAAGKSPTIETVNRLIRALPPVQAAE